MTCRSSKVKKTKNSLLSHYFLFLFPGISTFTTKVSRTRMCFMCRTLLMELPPYSLTRINSLKMAPWHWRVSQTAEHIHCTFYCAQTHPYVQCWIPPSPLFPSLHPVGRLSEECEYFAYGLSSSGSDWVTVRFMKADDLTTLPDVLERVKFSCLAWTHDAKGVFYNCYPRQEGKTDG